MKTIGFLRKAVLFYQIAELRELWELLSQNLSISQIYFIEDMLTLKLRSGERSEGETKKAY